MLLAFILIYERFKPFKESWHRNLGLIEPFSKIQVEQFAEEWTIVPNNLSNILFEILFDQDWVSIQFSIVENFAAGTDSVKFFVGFFDCFVDSVGHFLINRAQSIV